MDELTLDEAMEDLESAEDFLNYFSIAFDPSVVHVNRLHILQRFHDYLAKAGELSCDEGEDERRATYVRLLAQAYGDFVSSDALTEKVFKVFHMHEPQTTFVPVTAITLNRIETGAAPVAPESGCGCGGGGCHSAEATIHG
ncbi:MAG: nitrogenase-stabilizing/protective protein NifW [Thiobacillaceae bacterium]|jgi:nitrogenase-stabilizing/protective protein